MPTKMFNEICKIFILIVLFFQFSKLVNAQGVGVGLSTYSINISGSILDYYVFTIRVINPSPYEIKTRVYFECRDCTNEIKLFGKKIAEKTIDHRSFFTIDKDDLTVQPNSFGEKAQPVKIIFSPKFIVKNKLKVYTPEALNFFIRLINKKYENSFSLPYYSLFIGERKISGLIVADVYASSFGYMGVTPSVGSSLEVHAKGMPLSSFIILCILILLIALFIYKKITSSKEKKDKQKHTK